MNKQELKTIGIHFEQKMIESGQTHFSKHPKQITLADLCNSPVEALHFMPSLDEFIKFFGGNYKPEQLRNNPRFSQYKRLIMRARDFEQIKVLTQVRGTRPVERAYQIYTLKSYRRIMAAAKKRKLLYAAWSTAKGPKEWLSPLTPYFFLRAYVFFRLMDKVK